MSISEATQQIFINFDMGKVRLADTTSWQNIQILAASEPVQYEIQIKLYWFSEKLTMKKVLHDTS
jgi:hypothetical protein